MKATTKNKIRALIKLLKKKQKADRELFDVIKSIKRKDINNKVVDDFLKFFKNKTIK